MSVMVLLVGEQPIPNLLPVLHVKPDEVLLVRTDRTAEQARRLHNVLGARCRVDELNVPAYDIIETRMQLGRLLTEKGWRGPETLFNLTGGTKTMAFAAYELAVRLGADFFYLQSEGAQSLIYHYVTAGGAPVLTGTPQVIGPLLTLDDYLKAHVGSYTLDVFPTGDGGRFEKAIYDLLHSEVSEIFANVRLGPAVEIDLIVRCGNQVGIAEVKAGKPSKEGIDQLATAARREYLGTYIQRFLISARDWAAADNLKDLAAAQGIVLVELPGYDPTAGSLPASEANRLTERLRHALRCNGI